MAAALSIVFPVIGRTQEVIAVLSSDLGPYREAFEGFQESFKRPVSLFNLSERAPKIGEKTRLVVTFGGKAAQWTYPDQVILIYCMAPGTRLDLKGRKGRLIEIQMLPPPASVLSRLKEIQPPLKRLAAFWASTSMKEYIEETERISPSFGIKILSERLGGPNEFPDRLRALFYGSVDALWLLPDPLLIGAQSLSALKEFSWSNQIPLYVPTAGLVEQGGTASISSSFREIGRAAAIAAGHALAGEPIQGALYPEKPEVTLSVTSAEKTGLKIPSRALENADKVLP